MAELEIKYLKNSISDIELEYIKKHVPKRYDDSFKYKSQDDRSASLLAGILIYNNLGIDEKDIKYNKLKKPYTDGGPYFNISHSKDYIVFVKSKKKIGIDIELIDEKNTCIVDYVFNDNEKEYVENGNDEYSCIDRLTKLWTIKESVFKASGTEKRIEPRDIVVSDDKQLKFLDEVYNIYTIKALNHFISVSGIDKYDNVKLVEDKVIL